eukprot:PhF_6_TR41095/c0_g1_i2/m.62250
MESSEVEATLFIQKNSIDIITGVPLPKQQSTASSSITEYYNTFFSLPASSSSSNSMSPLFAPINNNKNHVLLDDGFIEECLIRPIAVPQKIIRRLFWIWLHLVHSVPMQ